MKNKRSLKVMILAAMTAVVTLLCSSCGRTNFTGKTKLFNPGEHTVVVSLGLKLETKNVQIENHPGYVAESVGSDYYHWIVLYRNTELVECVETTRGYTEFGEVVEQNKTMKLVEEN